MPDGGTSTHGDQLGPEFHGFLKHQKGAQAFEGAAAGVPEEADRIIRERALEKSLTFLIP